MVAKALGEIVLRTSNIHAMSDFYADVVGLEPINTGEQYRFFKVGDGFAGHTQVIALFDASIPPNQGDHAFADPDVAHTTLHHFAFAIDVNNYDAEKTRLESLGYQVGTSVHHWVKWRSLYINDPDGNTVEWVCYDASLGDD